MLAARHTHQGRAEAAPARQDLIEVGPFVQPGHVLVAALDHVGRGDETLQLGTRHDGIAHEGGPRVGIVGHGSGGRGPLDGGKHVGIAGGQDGSDRPRVQVPHRGPIDRVTDVPGQVELVRGGARCIQGRDRGRGVLRIAGVGREPQQLLLGQMDTDERAVGIGAELRGVIHRMTETGQPDRHVEWAAARMLLDGSVRPVHDVDERLSDDEDTLSHVDQLLTLRCRPGRCRCRADGADRGGRGGRGGCAGCGGSPSGWGGASVHSGGPSRSPVSSYDDTGRSSGSSRAARVTLPVSRTRPAATRGCADEGAGSRCSIECIRPAVPMLCPSG